MSAALSFVDDLASSGERPCVPRFTRLPPWSPPEFIWNKKACRWEAQGSLISCSQPKDYTRWRDLIEEAAIIEADAPSCPDDVDVSDVAALALTSGVRVPNKVAVSAAADLLEEVVDRLGVATRLLRRKPPKTQRPMETLLGLIVRGAEYAQAAEAYKIAARAVEAPRPVHAAPPMRKMPKPYFLQKRQDEDAHVHAAVAALVREEAHRRRIPTLRIGSPSEYRQELEAQALAQFYAPETEQAPATLKALVARAVDTAKAQLEKQNRELGDKNDKSFARVVPGPTPHVPYINEPTKGSNAY